MNKTPKGVALFIKTIQAHNTAGNTIFDYWIVLAARAKKRYNSNHRICYASGGRISLVV